MSSCVPRFWDRQMAGVDAGGLPVVLELLDRANKQFTFGFFQYKLDRIIPYAAIVRNTPADLLDDLDLQRLLLREDVIPPVPGDMEEEEY